MLVICICLIHNFVYYQFMKFLYNIFFFRPVAQFWLERRIDIAEVDGSSPFGSTTNYNCDKYSSNLSWFITKADFIFFAVVLTDSRLL